MQINQDVKDGKYQLSTRDGHIVIIENIKAIYPRLKNSNENNGWTPVNLNQSSQNRGIALLGAMKHYWNNSSTIGSINTLINMSSGPFDIDGHLFGYFTYMGYTYSYDVVRLCQVFRLPDDCIWSSIQSEKTASYQEGRQGGIFYISCKSGSIFSIHSSQSGSYTPLKNYIVN
jgi:hypothetical protein